MNLDRDSHFDPPFYSILIQDFTAPSHIGHRLAEIVGLRPAAFSEDTSVGGPSAFGVLGEFQITKFNVLVLLAQFACPGF